MVRIDPQVLIQAYCRGAFPMADRAGRIHWYTADPRGVIPLDSFHVSGTLRQLIRQERFEVRIDHAFRQTMGECKKNRPDGSWINDDLINAYVRLHSLGFAHSVEAWRDGRLVGGLYGVSLGGAFFGESMFHRETNASKVALVHLVQRLIDRGYKLLDTQATTPHLEQFGCIAIPAGEYLKRLDKALMKKCTFGEATGGTMS